MLFHSSRVSSPSTSRAIFWMVRKSRRSFDAIRMGGGATSTSIPLRSGVDASLSVRTITRRRRCSRRPRTIASSVESPPLIPSATPSTLSR